MRYLALFALCLAAASTVSAQKKPVRKSKGEIAAINAMLMAQSPDDQIKAADDLITKFADTDFKAYALYVEANAYESKNNHDKAIVYAEQSLAADPKEFDADFLIANVTATQTKDTDLDMAEKLSHAEKMANEGLETLKTVQKPAIFAQVPDAQWEQQKKQAESQGYQALGTIALVRKKPDDAIADYNKALAINPDPVIMLRVGRALLVAKKYDDAIGWFDKASAAPDASAQIKGIADSDKKRATALKAQAH